MSIIHNDWPRLEALAIMIVIAFATFATLLGAVGAQVTYARRDLAEIKQQLAKQGRLLEANTAQPNATPQPH